MRKPFFWKSRGGWYVKVGESQVFLDADEKKAYDAWDRMRELSKSGPEILTGVLIERFLQWAKRSVGEDSFKSYGRYASKFHVRYSHHRATEIRPFHVTEWLAAEKWKAPSQRHAVIAIKRCFSWATQEGLLERNPIATVKAPPPTRREKTVSVVEHEQIGRATDDGRAGRDGVWRCFVIALFHSGCRPGMVARLTRENVTPACDAWVFQKHKTSAKTGKPLVVWLSPCLQSLTRILLATNRTGPLFRNTRGEPWSRNAIRCRMRRLRVKLGLPAGTVSYGYRHGFVTRSLLNGVDIATTAELAGHSDTRMIAAHYSHLSQEAEYLRTAAAKAVKRA